MNEVLLIGDITPSHVSLHVLIICQKYQSGSRIPRKSGRQPSRRRAPAYKFAKFVEKLHEIKKILVRSGGHSLDAPLCIRHRQ